MLRDDEYGRLKIVNIVIPHEGRVRTLIRSSFLLAQRQSETGYGLSGDSFQMAGVTAAQVMILPDDVAVTEGDTITPEITGRALPIESFITVSAEDALADALGLVLRASVADGKITDDELLRIAPALEGRTWRSGISAAVGDVYASGASLWRCVQAHTTQSDWKPGQATALWHKVEVVSKNETRVWDAGISYAVGDVVAFPDASGQQYECIQAHTSQSGWEPSNVPALWRNADA